MNKDDAKEFVKEMLQGIWSNWEAPSFQYEGWIYMLQNFDYETSRQAVRDYFIDTTKLYREPNIAQIKRLLLAAKQKAEGGKANKPVMLYKIIKESNIGKMIEYTLPSGKTKKVKAEGGTRFYSSSETEVPEEYEIENQAQRNRKMMDSLYRGRHIIIYSGKGDE